MCRYCEAAAAAAGARGARGGDDDDDDDDDDVSSRAERLGGHQRHTSCYDEWEPHDANRTPTDCHQTSTQARLLHTHHQTVVAYT